MDAGSYRWEACETGVKALLLEGRGQTQRMAFEQVAGLPVSAVRVLLAVMRRHEVDAEALGALASDGVAARQRAVARFCGLGRELEGDTFDELLWRKRWPGFRFGGFISIWKGWKCVLTRISATTGVGGLGDWRKNPRVMKR